MIESPQRYSLGGQELVSVVPPESYLPFEKRDRKTYYRRILKAGDVQAHAVSLPPGTRKPDSIRHEGLIVLMVSGSMSTQVDGHSTHECGPMSITYHPAGQSGTGTVGPEGVRMFVLSLDQVKCRQLESEGLAARSWHPMDSPLVALKALREFAIGDEESAIAIEELTVSMIVNTSRTLAPATRRPRWWGVLKELLQEEHSTKISLQQLADAVGVHPVHLCATFHRIEGKTLGQIRREIKVKKACELAMATKWSLGDIAHELGYADQSHFVRAFQSTVGFAPSMLRGFECVCESALTQLRKP